MLTWNEWKLESGFSNEDLTKLEEQLQSGTFEIDWVQMGFATQEEQEIAQYYYQKCGYYCYCEGLYRATLSKVGELFILHDEYTKKTWVDLTQDLLMEKLVQLQHCLYSVSTELEN